jgi:hypothetical protein
MAWIDGNGRVFGRVNLIDAALLVFALVLIPIGIATSRVFRERPPRIDAVVPESQPAGPERRIRLQGSAFHPYLRVFFFPAGQSSSLMDRAPAQMEGRFLLESPTAVEVQLPALPPGSYDMHLLDETREILVRPSAITLQPPPAVTLRADVRFVVLADVAALVKVGDADLANRTADALAAPGHATLLSMSLSAAPLSAVDAWSLKGGRTLSISSPARAIEARLAVPASKNSLGIWIYRDQPIRPGDAFIFETAAYSARGVVTAVSVDDVTTAAPHDPRGARP